MKRRLIGAVMIVGIASQLAAQTNLPGGVVVLPLGGALLVPGTSSPAWSGEPPCDRQAQAARRGQKFPYWGFACDSFYNADDGHSYSTPSVTVAIPQVAAPAPPATPPSPPAPTIRPEVREYHWPSSASNSSATTFSIVSRDGRVESASMVWVQDDVVCYATANGGQGRMPIDSIDRQATLQRNAEKRLNFWLPSEKL